MFTGTLFTYQQEAFERLVERQKVLLAYDMGLGKSPITIAATEHLMDTGEIDSPVLILALSSLKYQWAAEIRRFTDSTPLVIDGSPTKRESQYERAMDWESSGVDYVICNYEQVVNDWSIISALPVSAIIADEVGALRGFRSKRARATKRLGHGVPIRFGLTGTPIENGKPEEVFSILQFIDPEVLGAFDMFDRSFIVRNGFGGVERYRNLPVLFELMQDVMVRKQRTDPDVRDYMPQLRRRQPFLVKFDPASRRLYDHIRADLLRSLDEAAEMGIGSGFDLEAHYGAAPSPNDPTGRVKGQIMAQITALRMCCAHPRLLVNSAEAFLASFEGGVAKGSAYAAQLYEDGLLDKLPATPRKAAAVTRYVTEHLSVDPAHKVVIFSTFIGTVDLLHGLLPQSVVYTGSMNARAKEAARQRFRTDPTVRVLISSDAGGYGVDLPEGNLLINYDLPWKAGTAAQRDSRIIRASSTFDYVTVENFLIEGSIEVRQHDMLQQKNRVAAAVVDGQGINDRGGVDLTLSSLRRFLSDP